MEYRKRLSVFFFTDSIIVITAFFIGSHLVDSNLNDRSTTFLLSIVILLVSHHFFSYLYKLYKKAWMYASIGELIIVFKTITNTFLFVSCLQFMMFQAIDYRLLVVTWMLHTLLIGGSRFCWRVINNSYKQEVDDKKRTLIVGAGSAGTMVARQLLNNHYCELKPVAFIDDDEKKHQLDILGIPVLGGREKIEKVVEHLAVETIVIAIPSLGKRELNKIVQECVNTGKKTQTIPKLEDIMTGKVSVNHFRDVQVEDLLGREPVQLDTEKISEFIMGKIVLITGAGGSIGSEICRQICKFTPKKLILLGHGENSIYTIMMELKEMYRHKEIEFVAEIADIQDGDKMLTIMSKHHPNVVYHAAAHKHVPLMESNPEEAVKNNIIGTLNVANAAKWSHVDEFVMISTDKAVNPTSVMGASKRLAEILIQNINLESETKFVAVRFGNVLGSRGSVIPLFKRQIQQGGPVTVTHPDMVRYFMTIPEASRLVIQAGALANGGEIFVLDMGEPVKIVELAMNLIKLSGNSVEEIGIEFTGMRTGEKLYEELLNPNEYNEIQVFPKIYTGKTTNYNVEAIMQLINEYPLLDETTLKARLLELSNEQAKSSKKLAVL
ncbi:nucleoside-diphosphate sugar epimerase/dehydratase [Robertmurraya sp. DFI.2.37]|uniref:polysaccharide biosynthesis protein n=1 Tax=Robertmurraya sp. DFI.2.37 TaxID=3031819 RepID=UPI0012491F88|nr:nucleoside-diphosphate sugar epimerase/dehydratase [Robertmurraya sp. DFI.2.37]MDF1508404.1 nucleoside-diphosphate sugar epimerase/dehydratase [Robertmurraya sp. DFI.2.37]